MLKETVAYCTSNSSPVYCIMLDASKAFDRVSYAELFLMLNRNISCLVIRLLVGLTLYCNQFYCVKLNNRMSALSLFITACGKAQFVVLFYFVFTSMSFFPALNRQM